VRSARALAVGSAVVLAVCFGVVIVCGKSHPDGATAAACGSFAVLVVLLAALRRVFGTGRGQAVRPGAGGRPGGRVPCSIHPDGHLYGCPVTAWQAPARRGAGRS
jgi:hypothetical protein